MTHWEQDKPACVQKKKNTWNPLNEGKGEIIFLFARDPICLVIVSLKKIRLWHI